MRPIARREIRDLDYSYSPMARIMDIRTIKQAYNRCHPRAFTVKIPLTQQRIEDITARILSQPDKRYKHKSNGESKSIPLPGNWPELRVLIRERDCGCVDCGSDGQGVHHIDFDRQNNALDNLVFLCWPCHMQRHISHRQQRVEGVPPFFGFLVIV